MNNKLKICRDKIKEQNEISKLQASKYEASECWSYAYLTRWVVLENGVKLLYNTHNKERIREGAMEWLKYLDGKLTTKPNNIKDFSVQTKNIPSIKFITDILGSCNSVETVLSYDHKYRPKRNDIAHRADDIKTKKTYLQYRKAIDGAIAQLLSA